MTLKLFAGISTVSISSNPCWRATFVTSSKSRTPHNGFRLFRDWSKQRLDSTAVPPTLKGPYKNKKPPRHSFSVEALNKPKVASHGLMWIMLMQMTRCNISGILEESVEDSIMPSAWSVRGSGGVQISPSRLDRWIRAWIEARDVSSGSVGYHSTLMSFSMNWLQ